MTTYDENILQQYADQLYREAKWIVFSTTLIYGLISLLLALLLGLLLTRLSTDLSTWGVAPFIVPLLGIGFGIQEGRRKAFHLKLQAQQILCQRQIEMNTRR
jgi:hypothetical protein